MTWYQTYLVDTGRAAALWLLIGFVVTFAVTRWITLRIRSRSQDPDAGQDGAIKDVFIGGVHIHHQVWGILLVLIVGLLEFRFNPASPWEEVSALLFGIGAALALDEFALWLHLDDVYWSPEGRKSIDAVLLAAVAGIAMLMATSPVGVDAGTAQSDGLVVASIAVAIHVMLCIICLLKGKNVIGILGLAIPLLGDFGSFRLAKPESYWAKRFYGDKKMGRARGRFPADRATRTDWLRNKLTGGA